MPAAILKLIYSGYLIITAIFLINIISCTFFQKSRQNVFYRVLLALIWPLSIFSPKGRKAIFNQLSKL